MTTLLRHAFLVTLLMFGSRSLNAQTTGIPSELELNRYGLTLSWWGQAVNDPGRDTILHMTADEQNVYLQSTSGIVSTFNAETGRRLWSALVGIPNQRAFAAESNETELLISSGLTVYSFDKLTGELIWEFRVPEHPSASPSVSENHVFIGAIDGSVFAFDLRRVRELYEENMLPEWSDTARDWRFKTATRVVSPPIHSGDVVLFASEGGTVYGLTEQDKQLRFQFETDAKIRTPLGSTRNFVFVTNEDSRLYCLNQVNGSTQWTFSSGAPQRLRPNVVGNQVYTIPTRKGLFALDLATGRRLWNVPKATEFVSVSENRVYARDFAKNLLIIDRNDGRVIGKIGMRGFPNVVHNERTDRIFVSNDAGLVLSIREQSREFPIYHAFPERRPIMPLLTPEEDEAQDAESTNEENPFEAGN